MMEKSQLMTSPSKIGAELPEISNPISVGRIPVIDMQKLISEDSMKSELDKLDLACKEWGFFQLGNHGLDVNLVEKVKHEVEEFFKLPEEQLKNLRQLENDIEGFGQALQNLNLVNSFFMVTRPLSERKPHLFPYLPQSFGEILETYSVEVYNLSMIIFTMLEKVLNMEDQELTSLFRVDYQSMRMNHYPPSPQPDQIIGFTPHKDPEGLTFLIQVKGADGLQIKKEGEWIPVKAIPNAIMVNVGDSLQIITNGIYQSVEHRVTVNSGMDRIAIATFCSPKFDEVMGPSKSLAGPDNPALYDDILVKEYLDKFYIPDELKEMSSLDSMKKKNQMA